MGNEIELTKEKGHEKSVLQPGETVEQRIKEEVAKFDLPEARIAELREQFKDLKIRPVPGPNATKEEKKAYRESYDTVKSAIAVVRPLRTGVEKMRKHLKSDYLIIGKGIDTKAEEYTKLLTAIEEPLKSELDAADAAELALKEAEKQAEQKKVNDRVTSLLDAGLKFDGNFYSLGAITADIATIKTLPDAAFENLISKVKETKQRIDEEEAARLKEEEEAKAALQKQKEDQEAEQQRLEEEKKQLEDEKAEIKKQRTNNRIAQLANVRVLPTIIGDAYVYHESDDKHVVRVLPTYIQEYPEEMWASYFEEIKKLSEEIYKAEQERVNAQKEKDNRFIDRVATIEKLGMSHFAKIPGSEEHWGHYGTHVQRQVSLTRDYIYDTKESDWNDVLFEAAEEIRYIKLADEEEVKRRQEETRKAEERKARINKRERDLISLGWEETGDGDMLFTSEVLTGKVSRITAIQISDEIESEWEAVLQFAKMTAVNMVKSENEELERRKKIAEEERQTQLSDAEKYLEYVKALRAVPVPVVSENSPLKDIFRQLEEQLGITEGALTERVQSNK